MHDFTALAAQVWRAVSPIAALSPGQRPGGNDVALIKVSRSVRATCFMRGNAPCGVKGVMGYALSARGIFAPAQKCRMYQSRSTFPQGVALGYGQHLGFQPAPTIYQAFCTNLRVQQPFYCCTCFTNTYPAMSPSGAASTSK